MKKILSLIFTSIFLITASPNINAAQNQTQNSKQIRKLTKKQAEDLKRQKNAKKKAKQVVKSNKVNSKAKTAAQNVKPIPKSKDYSQENPLIPTTEKLISQRKAFDEAHEAIRNGNMDYALTLRQGVLKDYPLAVWIDYWELSTIPELSKYSKVIDFIKSKKHQELGELLKDKYIEYLSKQGQYAKVLELFNGKPFDDVNTVLNAKQQGQQCRYYEARLNRGFADNDAIAYAHNLFLQLRAYPSSCSGLIYIWGQNGNLNDAARLEKFERAYIAKNYGDTTKSIAKSLENSKFSSQVQKAMSFYQSPSKALTMEANNDDEHFAAVLAYKRYINLATSEAAALFESFCSRFHVSDTERFDLISLISKSFLSRLASEEQVLWVDKNLPAVGWNDEIKQMRMRKAIWFAQWDIVYRLYDHLSVADRNQINWQYWKARSAFEIGKKSEAKKYLKNVAKDRSFFGFLAAQELSIEPAFNHEKLSKRAVWPKTVANNKAAIRFFELKAINDPNASIEWREVAKYAPTDEALLMAEWAVSTGNTNYAIQSVIAGKRWSALDYRFPKPFYDLYTAHSQTSGVPISYLYGISRQESMMNPVIKSPVGAVGLMQLMPSTAAMVSRQNGWSYKGASQLVDPNTNIRLGSTYLRDLLAKFDNNRVLASAAYNAGPGRINIWKSKDGVHRDAAMYVENIPFKETRQYVQNVLLYDVIYHKLLTGKNKLLLHKNEQQYSY